MGKIIKFKPCSCIVKEGGISKVRKYKKFETRDPY